MRLVAKLCRVQRQSRNSAHEPQINDVAYKAQDLVQVVTTTIIILYYYYHLC